MSIHKLSLFLRLRPTNVLDKISLKFSSRVSPLRRRLKISYSSYSAVWMNWCTPRLSTTLLQVLSDSVVAQHAAVNSSQYYGRKYFSRFDSINHFSNYDFIINNYYQTRSLSHNRSDLNSLGSFRKREYSSDSSVILSKKVKLKIIMDDKDTCFLETALKKDVKLDGEDNEHFEIFDRKKNKLNGSNTGKTNTRKSRLVNLKKRSSQTEERCEDSHTTELSRKPENIQPKSSHSRSKRKSKISFHPTHCLALRISNKYVHHKIVELQNVMKNLNCGLDSCFVPMSSLHMNLILFSIKELADMKVVIDTLEESLPRVEKLSDYREKALEFNSLSSSFGKSIFLNASNSAGLEYLNQINSIVRSSMLERNIEVNLGPFKPHVLVMKHNTELKKKGVTNIPIELFEPYMNDYFGKEEISEIHFCSMTSKENGFFKVLASLDIQEAKLVLPDILVCTGHGEILKQKNRRKSDSGQEAIMSSVSGQKHHPTDHLVLQSNKKFKLESNNDTLEGHNEIVGKCYHSSHNAAAKMKSKHSEERQQRKKKKEKTINNLDTPVKGKNSEMKEKFLKKSPATHFLAIRLYNQKIHEKVAEIQDAVFRQNEDFKPSFIKLPTLHMTLAVLSLNNNDELNECIKALALALDKIETLGLIFEKKLEFISLGNFDGQVVFIDLKKTDVLGALKIVVSNMKEYLSEQTVYVKKEPFTPHVTVMKLTNCYRLLKKKGIKRIPCELYKKFKDEHFGEEQIKEIFLCSMTDKKEDDGFYKILATINLKDGKLAIAKEKNTDISDKTKVSLPKQIAYIDNSNVTCVMSCHSGDERNDEINETTEWNTSKNCKKQRKANDSVELSSKSFGGSRTNIDSESSLQSESGWDIISDDEMEKEKLSLSLENNQKNSSNKRKGKINCIII